MHNSTQKPKIIAIVGKTATGKSDLAVFLAEQLNGEVISADSRQVYKGLDLGTGKITEEEMRGIPHYMLDVADPKQIYSVEQYISEAQKIIEEIIARNRIPILVGGTGFYIDSLISGNEFPNVPPDFKLRENLQSKSTEELFTILKDKDNERASAIDRQNRVRLIRAIEIIETLGKVPKMSNQEKYECLWIGIDLPDSVLKERIERRLVQRLNAGMLDEAERLFAEGLSHDRMEQLGLEYRYMSRLMRNLISREEFINQLSQEIWRYAKRQKMWFKRNEKILWHSPEDRKQVLENLLFFLK